MLSIDTNLLFHAYAQDRPEHAQAWAWLLSLADREDVVISEFILIEFYRLLRNPAAMERPLSAPQAVEVISAYRCHPRWRLVGFTPRSQSLHDDLFRRMSAQGIGYRRIYDARLALTLRHHGVTEFATTNVGDFEGFGFVRVWNPLLNAC
jgi:toxin-antitoxin system PIN domain toxin